MVGFGPACQALRPGLPGPGYRARALPQPNRPGVEAWPDPVAFGEGV
jgi:hypothetical protein